MTASTHYRSKLGSTIGCFVLLCLTVAALISGNSTLLGTPLFGVPGGQWISIASLLAGPIAGVIVSRPATWLRRLSMLCVAAALAWLPAGALLAGNVSLSFSGSPTASMWFWRFTGVAGLASILLSITAVVIAARSRNAPST